MKALAFVILLLALGDMAFDHGAGIVKVGHAGTVFAHEFAAAFAGSLFAA